MKETLPDIHPSRIKKHNAYCAGVRQGLKEALAAIEPFIGQAGRRDAEILFRNVANRLEYTMIPACVEIGKRKARQRRKCSPELKQSKKDS